MDTLPRVTDDEELNGDDPDFSQPLHNMCPEDDEACDRCLDALARCRWSALRPRLCALLEVLAMCMFFSRHLLDAVYAAACHACGRTQSDDHHDDGGSNIDLNDVFPEPPVQHRCTYYSLMVRCAEDPDEESGGYSPHKHCCCDAWWWQRRRGPRLHASAVCIGVFALTLSVSTFIAIVFLSILREPSLSSNVVHLSTATTTATG